MMIRKFFTVLRRHFRRGRYLLIRNLSRVESRQGFILDLGGGPASFFSALFPRPEQIILVEIDYGLARRAKRTQTALRIVVADGERLPFADHSIEMTVCNSVIEHVNRPDALAAEIHRISRDYFVQTPNGDFPIETHSFIAIPFYNYIPWTGSKRFACKMFGANFEYVNSVHYLSEKRLRILFPEAVITYERVLGLKKSFHIYHITMGTA